MTGNNDITDRLVRPITTQLGPTVRADHVWTNPLGGRTYSLRGLEYGHYLKVSPPDAPSSHDLTAEAERLAWIGSRVHVPQVLESGSNQYGSWLRTLEMSGSPASNERWRRHPDRTAKMLGYAIRCFHDQLAPAESSCPWSWRIADRVSASGSSQAARMARFAPPENDLVVAHGDLCAPNVLLTNNGDEVGFLDVGKLGLADRAADLGCHIWSLERNQLGDVVDEFLDAYRFTGDKSEVRWYRDFYEVA